MQTSMNMPAIESSGLDWLRIGRVSEIHVTRIKTAGSMAIWALPVLKSTRSASPKI